MLFKLGILAAVLTVLYFAAKPAFAAAAQGQLRFVSRRRRRLPLVDQIRELGKLLEQAPKNLPMDIRQQAKQALEAAQLVGQMNEFELGYAEDLGDAIGGFYGILEFHIDRVRRHSHHRLSAAS